MSNYRNQNTPIKPLPTKILNPTIKLDWPTLDGKTLSAAFLPDIQEIKREKHDIY